MVLFTSEMKIFIAVILSSAISQGLKIILNVIRDKKGVSLKDFVVTGGMPSTHSALVSSLFAILILETGISPLTVIGLVIFTITITDSMGVRRTAGEDAKALKVRATPTFFVNGKKLEQFGPDPLRALIRSELNK